MLAAIHYLAHTSSKPVSCASVTMEAPTTHAPAIALGREHTWCCQGASHAQKPQWGFGLHSMAQHHGGGGAECGNAFLIGTRARIVHQTPSEALGNGLLQTSTIDACPQP